MKNIKPISSPSLVFRKWKRKGYAIFASLKKVVKIGQLAVGVCKTSFCRIPSMRCMLGVIKEAVFGSDDAFGVESLPDPWDSLRLLQPGEMVVDHVQVYEIKRDKYNLKSICCRVQ